MDKERDIWQRRYKTIILLVGSFILGFVVFTLYLYPILTGKQEEISILDNLDKNLVDLANESDPQNSTVEAFNIWYAPEGSFGIRETKSVNWSWFWKVFRSNSAWQLEAWHPVDEEWVSEWQGTNLNEWLNISRVRSGDNGSEKITLTVTNMHPSQDLFFRFKFGIDLRVKEFVNKSSNYEYELVYPANATEDYTVFFNFSDVKPLIQNGVVIPRHGVKEVGGKDIFYFMLTQNMSRNPLPVGGSFEIDPIFGDQDTIAGGSNLQNDIEGLVGVCPSDGIADNITIYLNGWDAGEEVTCVLYNNATNVLVGYTEERTTGGTGWFVFDFIGTVNLVADTEYLICGWADDIVSVSYNPSGTGYFRKDDYDYVPPAPVPVNPFVQSVSDSTYDMGIYCSYTEGVGELSNQFLLSGWMSGGNNSVSASLLSGWMSGGNESITITLIDHSPSNIRTNTTGDAWFIYNITTSGALVNNWSIVWAYGINHTETITHNTSYSLEDPLAEDKLRSYNRNENLTQETKFNTTTGDGSIGGFGEWNTHDLNYGVTFVDNGSNWTVVNATEEIVHHLFNSIGFVDREAIIETNHTGRTIEISKTDYAKIEFNMTDTDWYDTGHYRNTSMFLHLYVNQTSASKPLLVYFANESYTTGQPASSPYASLVGSISPGDSFEYTEENSSYYDVNFIINKTGFVGNVNATSKFYIILRSTVPTAQKWDLYYADQNISHTVSGVTHYHNYTGHKIIETTVNSGNTWSSNASTPDMYFNFISLNEEDVSEVKLYANDTDGNEGWSSVHTDLIDITNYPPNPADIIVPNVGTNYTSGVTIPINYNWIGDPNFDTCWVNITLWDWTTTTIQSYIVNQSLTQVMVSANNSNFTYNWDTTGVSPNNYTIAINITDPYMLWANSSSDVFYIWSSNQVLLSGWFSGGNATVVLTNQFLLSGWFSGGNNSVSASLLSGWMSGGNTSMVNQFLLSGWFSGGNTTIMNISITNEYPSDTSIVIPLQPTVYATINSTTGDTMNMSIYYGSQGSENILLATHSNVGNGSYSADFFQASNRTTNYYWRIQLDDGVQWINETYSFRTEGYSGGGGMVSNYQIPMAIGASALLFVFYLFIRRKKRRQE